MIRNRSIRTKLALLVLAPVLVMLVLGAGVVQPALDEVNDADRSSAIADVVLASMEYRDTVEHERFTTLEHLQTGEAEGALATNRAETDIERGLLLQTIESSGLAGDAEVGPLLTGLIASAEGLVPLREGIDSGSVPDSIAADEGFQDLLAVQQDFNRVLRTAGDAELVRRGDAITAYYDAEEALSDLGGFIGARLDGSFDAASIRDAYALEEIEELEFDRFKVIGEPSEVALLIEALESDAHETFEGYLDDVVDNGNDASTTPQQWFPATREMFDTANAVEDIVFDRFVERAVEEHDAAQSRALVFGAGSAGVALIAIIAAFLLGRSLARRVRRLSEEAHDAAVERLPEVLASVTDADAATIGEKLPGITSDGRDEIGELAESFNTVLRTAVETSVDHVQKRASTMTSILLSLGRRNQALIDRQLGILDDLESRVEDPSTLEGLFRIDHMLTRLRRNSENLLVLASERPARQWSEPVALLDVVRGATSEVENLERVDIDLEGSSGRMVAGSHAVDLSHVLAELIDNALSYSPPTAPVAVRATEAKGLVRVWVIDRGVGMSDTEITEANQRIAEPPNIAEVVADQVGFQVLGRLSRRLGVAVTIHANPGGGLAASIDLPADAFARADETAPPTTAPPVVETFETTEPAPAPTPEPVIEPVVDPTDPSVEYLSRPAIFGEQPTTPASAEPTFVEAITPNEIVDPTPVEPAPQTMQAPIETSGPEAPGFRKRVPGQAIAETPHGSELGGDVSFQRLPDPAAPEVVETEDPFTQAERRRAALSGLQAGVARGRDPLTIHDPDNPDVADQPF